MHGLGTQEEPPSRRTEPRCSRRLPDRGDSELAGGVPAAVDPPSGDSPYAMATASTIVDLPEPFSPTRNVTPLASVSPSLSSCVDRRDVGRPLAGGSRLRPPDTRTTGGWSKSTAARYGPYRTG